MNPKISILADYQFLIDLWIIVFNQFGSKHS